MSSKVQKAKIGRKSYCDTPGRSFTPESPVTERPVMATVNGVTPTESGAHLDASSNLGKRKRLNEDAEGQLHGRILQNQSASLQNSMRSALDYLRGSVASVPPTLDIL